jgi:iron-sulfur cluster assembly protein
MSTQTKIHPQMTISDILGMFPDKAQRLSQEITNAGLHCIGCNAATWETLESGMLSHGKNPSQIEQLVTRLNALLDEKIDTTTITMTPEAAKKFLEFAALEGKPGAALRFGEEMAGCSGFEYVLDFSEQASPDDEVFTTNGIEVHVHKKQVKQLLGCQIDYVNGIRDTGFKVINPNVRSSCGCGTSHGYK